MPFGPAQRYVAPASNAVDGFQARRYTNGEKNRASFLGRIAMRKSVIFGLIVFSATRCQPAGSV